MGNLLAEGRIVRSNPSLFTEVLDERRVVAIDEMKRGIDRAGILSKLGKDSFVTDCEKSTNLLDSLSLSLYRQICFSLCYYSQVYPPHCHEHIYKCYCANALMRPLVADVPVS